MKRLLTLTLIMMMTLLGTTSFAALSEFTLGNDGWTCDGGSAEWQITEGDPGGYLRIGDIGDSWVLAVAPSIFDGEWDSAGQVSASIIAFNTPVVYAPAFRVGREGTVYEFVFSGKAATSWQTFAAPLSGSGWEVLSAGTGYTLAQVLQDVDYFAIRMDFNSSTTPQTDGSGIDNVQASVVPIPAAVWLLGSGLGFLALRRKGAIH